MVRPSPHDDETSHFVTIDRDGYGFGTDERLVVVEHWGRFLADVLDVSLVCSVDAGHDGLMVLGLGRADANTSHSSSLADFDR